MLATFDHRLGLGLPAARLLQAVLEVANAGEILIEPAAVACADVSRQIARLVGDGVENAAARVERADLGLDLFGRPLQEKLIENVGSTILRRNGDTRAGPRQAARAVHRQ